MVTVNIIDINKTTFSVPPICIGDLLDRKAKQKGDQKTFLFYNKNKFISQFIISKVASHTLISSFSSYDEDGMPFYR